MSKTAKIILGLTIIGLAVVFVLNSIFFGESFHSKISFGENTWNVEVVESLTDKARGLSGRESLDSGSGMLFIFSKSDLHGIWMKDMNFNIDIIWFDENFKVTGLKKDASPESYPEAFYPDSPSRYVLELNSGEVDRAQIKIGDVFEFFEKQP